VLIHLTTLPPKYVKIGNIVKVINIVKIDEIIKIVKIVQKLLNDERMKGQKHDMEKNEL
jgi:hypothetical protein